MKRNQNQQAAIDRIKREILLVLLIVIGFICFITVLYREKQPERRPLELDPPEPSSAGEALLKAALREPEAVLPKPPVAPLPAASVPPAAPTPPTLPALEASEALPSSAPEMDPARLSPALQRSHQTAGSLRTEAFIEPDSDMNRETVESLRKIRRARHQPTQAEPQP